MQVVSVSSILATPEQRAAAREELVEHFVQLQVERFSFPPAQVEAEGEQYRLLSGVECLLAAEKAGSSTMPAIIEPRTSEQKREDVIAFLTDPKWREESSRAIARYCYVRRERVVKLRSQQGDGASERQVQRNGKVYTQKIPVLPPRSNPHNSTSSVPIILHDKPYDQVELPAAYADVILTVVPDSVDVAIADLAPRMAAHLNASGIACLIFNPFQALWLSDWLRALKDAGLLYRKLIAWQVTGLEQGRYRNALSDFELILLVGRCSIGGPSHPVIRGPHTPGVNHPNMQYQKPLWLILKLLEYIKQPHGGVLLDPLVQSGVTLLGARA